MTRPKIKSQQIHGKSYAMVHDRISYFRGEELYRDLSIDTELVHFDHEHAVVKAVVKDLEGRVLASGLAYEWKLDKKSMVNLTSFVENAETSAIGRALACLGIGIEDAYASAFEVENAQATEAALRVAPPVKVATPKPKSRSKKVRPAESIKLWTVLKGRFDTTEAATERLRVIYETIGITDSSELTEATLKKALQMAAADE